MNYILNPPTKLSSLFVVPFAVLMILTGAFLGVKAISPTLKQLSTSTSSDTTTIGLNPSSQTVLAIQRTGAEQIASEPVVALAPELETARNSINASAVERPLTDSLGKPSPPQNALQETTVNRNASINRETTLVASLPRAIPPAVSETVIVDNAIRESILISGVLSRSLERVLDKHFVIQSLPVSNERIRSGGMNQRADLLIDFDQENAIATYQQTYAVATRFDAIHLDISWRQLGLLWRDVEDVIEADYEPLALGYDEIVVPVSMIAGLERILGPAGSYVRELKPTDDAVEVAWDNPATLLFVPFEELVPRLAVVAIDGQKPIENANRFEPERYPLSVTFAIHQLGATTRSVERAKIMRNLPKSNRDPNRLTVIAMTGVTAMVRNTAAQMDVFGYDWPAQEVGSELAAADITHISNEVPFVEDCETDISEDNLVFCSKIEYFKTLEACGVDIIGLTGNHQNDYGRQATLDSLDFYKSLDIPVYGGGINKESAFAPLYYEHNGNRLAFLGANSYGPEFAWATDNKPGSAQFDLNIMSATIRNIHARDLADVVMTELQYQERYDVSPLIEQRVDFNALIHAGADIVTGVQSHVPQAVEFTDGRLILFGLGNLFFDQMQRRETREGMIVKHTIYDGRHISTQILTTLLYDAGQPRWMSDSEREELLTRVFNMSYWE